MSLSEHRIGKKYDYKIKSAGKFGPIIGAALGIVPQCGFSILGVMFYFQGYITLGTLLAIFLATSDEALPVLISNTEAINNVLPFILIKFSIAVVWGYLVDFVLKSKVNEVQDTGAELAITDECLTDHFNFKEVLYHSIKKSLKIFLYMFLINLALGYLVETFEINKSVGILGKTSFIQPVFVSLVGLIPNCAISVGIIQSFVLGVISFSSAIAGLSANAGLGLIYLVKESKNKIEAVKIIGLLYVISALTGVVLHFII
ncbi:putative manganese transporter [Caloramator sp. mosi_1]|uniref:putative manganese transporter n=1 Tax=Caloramator sp. mosi_1 TaxID=3023090 RepID=UPI00235F662C|nr:putative manganese transporter [Caloramator sp. mosi_1]WDC84315.1 putative manganese transporter [Caloramator sp. mosi_1]